MGRRGPKARLARAVAMVLRFVSRELFATTSYPQQACRPCKWRGDCREMLLPGHWRHNFWLVRSAEPVTEEVVIEDGTLGPGAPHAVYLCARNWKHEPHEVRRLRLAERAKLPAVLTW